MTDTIETVTLTPAEMMQEIERLRAENEKLRAALNAWESVSPYSDLDNEHQRDLAEAHRLTREAKE